MGRVRGAGARIRHFATYISRPISTLFSWLGRVADPLAKWATTLALIGGGVWAYYQFALAGAADWAINLDVSTEVIPYHDNLALLVVHVRSKNPRNSEVDVEPPDGAFKLTIKELPEGKSSGSVIDPDDPSDSRNLLKTVDLLPKGGYVFAPGADFEDVTSVVLPLGAKVWLTARLDYDGDYVSTSNIAVVRPPIGAPMGMRSSEGKGDGAASSATSN
jgi:hypothetical protein